MNPRENLIYIPTYNDSKNIYEDSMLYRSVVFKGNKYET